MTLSDGTYRDSVGDANASGASGGVDINSAQ